MKRSNLHIFINLLKHRCTNVHLRLDQFYKNANLTTFHPFIDRGAEMKQEIERKYAVNYLPENLKIVNILDIEQAFIYKDAKTVIRIRKIRDKKSDDIKYIYTVKTKGDIAYHKDSTVANAYEIESYIQEEEFNKLIKNKISSIIRKTRMVIPIGDNLNVEMDIYKDYLQDLITAEVEFPSEDIAKNFQKPDWLGEEMQYKELSNWKLSNMTKEEWMKKVTKESLENNRKIILDLKKNDKI